MDSKLLHCFLSVMDHRNVTAAAAAQARWNRIAAAELSEKSVKNCLFEP